MKKLLFFFSVLFALLLTGCTEDDINNVVERVEPTPPVAVEDITAMFGDGAVSVSTTGNLLAKAKSRATFSRTSTTLADYATPASFASKAGAVGAYTPTYTSAPEVPADAEPIQTIVKDEWGNSNIQQATLTSGHSYYINGDEKVVLENWYFQNGSGEGTADVYVKPGVNLTEMLNTDNGKVRYFILPGATLTTTNASAALYNWGTLYQNGIYQYSSWNGSAYICEQVIENYGQMICTGSIQVNGTLYNAKDMSAILNGTGNLYVDGNLNAESNFGFAGKLYVKGEMSGDININNQLAAHVGSVNTTGQVTVTAGAQLMVEGDVTAASMKLDGEWSGAVETVIKGTANISGNVDVASGTKGYIELLLCENYTANASDIWVGCKSIVNSKFEMNGNANFTLANGVYLQAGEAVFAANTKMEMMSKAYFKVEGKLQLNNAYDNNLNGSGDELAIVKAATMGANYEDFSNTFTGNIGVDFGAWDYNSSTSLIDQNTNLKRLHDVAANVNYQKSDCNPGYQGVNQRGETPGEGNEGGDEGGNEGGNEGGSGDVKTPIGYAVYYLYRANNNTAADAKVVQADAGYYVGDAVTETPVEIEGFVADASEQTLILGEVQSENVITFYYDAIPNDPVLADCTVKFVDGNGVAVAPFYTIQQYVGNWVYADALEIAGYELNGEKQKSREMTGDNDEIIFVYRQLGEAPIINNNPVNPPSPDIIPDVPFTSDNLNIDLESAVQGNWIIQADDFAIHNGDILYVSIADTSNKQGHSAYNNFVEVNPSDNVTISLANIDDIYNAYKGQTTTCTDVKSPYYGQAVPYINQINGMLTLEVYLWPAKKEGASIVPIPPTEFLGITADGVDGKYLIGTEEAPRVYANDKYFVQVSAYASYNGGGHDAAMTSYVKVSFHISPRTAN